MTQGKKHMGGRKRYVKQQLNIPASRANIKEKTPSVSKPKSKIAAKGVTTNFGKSTLPKRVGIKSVHKTEWGPKAKPSKAVSMGKFTTIGTQPTRAMLGIKPKGGK